MSFCPKCKYEYKKEVTACPDCQLNLVVELLVEEKKESDPDLKFVPLPNLPGRIYGEMLKEVLDQRNIPSYIRSDGFSDLIQAPGTHPPGGVQLFVPEDRLEECIGIQHEMMDHI